MAEAEQDVKNTHVGVRYRPGEVTAGVVGSKGGDSCLHLA